MNKICRFLLITAIIGNCIKLNSQSVSYSPYSIFGIGEIETSDFSRNLGMGSVGIGLKSRESLNSINPASYSGIDSLSFTLEASFAGKFTRFNNGNSLQNNTLAGLKKMAIGFQVNSFLHTSLGMMPYSNMGYDIYMNKTTEGAPYVNYGLNLTGSGSINKFYIGNSVNITKNLVIGVNLSFLFGTLTQNEIIKSSISAYGNKIETKSYLHQIYPDFGIQYSGKLKNDMKYTIGGIFGFKSDLNLSHDVSFINTTDDISISDNSYYSKFVLPKFFGMGFSVNHKSGVTIAMDYVFQKWSDQKSNSSVVSYVNSNRLAAGIEYYPNVRIPKSYFERMFYQVGFNYTQSYLKLRGVQIDQKAMSVGIGLPLIHNNSYFTVSYERGIKGKIGNDLFREQYNQFNICIILRDIWFVKNMYD